MPRIACTHPGKIGDALYALPAIRWLCEKHGCQADFYTSEYCRPMEPLMRQQSCIADFIVPPDYSPDNCSCGVQPFQMPVRPGYDMVYHLGFRTTPDRALPDFIAGWTGAPHGLPIFYEFEKRDTGLTSPYVVVAPRGDAVFKEFIESCPFPVVQIGAKGEAVSSAGIDRTGADLVETCNILAGARAFFGVMSSQLVLANGFPIPRVAYDFGRNDMRHVVHSYRNHYPANPTTARLIDHVAYLDSYSETFQGPAEYYRLTSETPFIDELTQSLRGAYNPFHEHRRWEYGLTLQVAKRFGLKTCLDIGGGGSILSAVLMSQGVDTVTVDPSDYVDQHRRQSELLGVTLDYRQQDFMAFPETHTADLVACVSVLEHIEQDVGFFEKLLRHVKPGGILVLTVDFHPSGEVQWHGMQCRTYNAERLRMLASLATGFEVLGPMDYAGRGPHVYGYNFASLTLRRTA